MTKFYLVEYQEGGCDYTIGCGVRIRELDDVHTLHDAMLQAAEDIGENWRSGGDYSIDGAEILVVENAIDLADWLDGVKVNRESDAALRAKDEIEQAERAEYERLRAKFEGEVTK